MAFPPIPKTISTKQLTRERLEQLSYSSPFQNHPKIMEEVRERKLKPSVVLVKDSVIEWLFKVNECECVRGSPRNAVTAFKTLAYLASMRAHRLPDNFAELPSYQCIYANLVWTFYEELEQLTLIEVQERNST